MSDFETHPVGTAKRLAELEAENGGLRKVIAKLGAENREIRDELRDRLSQTRRGLHR